MKTIKNMTSAIAASLLLLSCTTDDMQFNNENDKFAKKEHFQLKSKDTIFNNITTVVSDSICNGEFEPPIVPKPPIRN